MNEDNIMKYETVLPEDFDGVFRFTNPTDEDFIGKWGGKEYKYPAQTTSPMIIPEHSPLEIQNIRKKFAKDLGEREFFKSPAYAKLRLQEINTDGTPRLNSIHMAGTYSTDNLTSFIQQCLKPLPISKALVTEMQKEKLEDKLTRDDDGELNTVAIDKKTSLKDKAFKNQKLTNQD